jgi:hypothetical protein
MDKYTVTQLPVSSILGFIDAGAIAIPEIQRPFVWKGRQVRDLIDSLYNGYPTGYLIIWHNPVMRLKSGKEAVGKKILIDGQQRITALMTAIAGYPILTEDYELKTIKIAFNPIAVDTEECFAVQTPVHLNSKHWIPDIAELFNPGFSFFDFINNYFKKNPDVNHKSVENAITQLLSVKGCPLGVIELVPGLDISEVTEIFVRINSKGKALNEADFAMSKIAADEQHGGPLLRKAIDYFCHLAARPTFYSQLTFADKEFMNSDYAVKLKWLKDDKEDIYDPDYGDMLRVSFMHTFGRGKLGDLVSLLSGRDFSDRTFKEAIAEESFSKLKSGVLSFMNDYNFKQFVLAIKSAGFTSPKLLNSKMTLDFAYTLSLLLRQSNEISKTRIQSYVQKWFVLSTLTSRYISSPESQMDRDLRSITSKGFNAFLRETEYADLSDTFWNVGLVQNLETSSVASPFFNTFIAAQIFSSDRSLFSNSSKVSDLISAGDVHHIFPREYLKHNGITDRAQYNQVANFTYLDTAINIAIGKKAPKDYFNTVLVKCSNEQDFYDNLTANCIPYSVLNMIAVDYSKFLIERRKMMARRIKNYYYAL